MSNPKWNKNHSQRHRGQFRRGNFSRNDSFRGRSWSNRLTDQQNVLGLKNDYTRKTYDKNTEAAERLLEKDIGVTEYVSALKGINGVIKSRFSDFQVSEIALDGTVAKLKDQSVPLIDDTEPAVDETTLQEKYNVDLLPTETWDKLNYLATTEDKNPSKVEIDVTGLTKIERTDIYDSINKNYGSLIHGKTITKDGKKIVEFAKLNKGEKIDRREKWLWPGEYIHFLVHKENMTTLDASTNIVVALHMPNAQPGFAGTKDRRAITTQWFSLFKVPPSKIAEACKWMRNIHVGNYKFSDKQFKLGDLKGNCFRIALRNVKSSDEEIADGVKSLEEKGFINYYGLQRFGNVYGAPTFLIGMKLLQGAYQEAVELILTPRAGPLHSALNIYNKSKNPHEAVFVLSKPQKHSIEGKLLKRLATNPKDFVAALFEIPRNGRTLYLHSYQSLIWNKCVSERIRKFSLDVTEGDLVVDMPIDKDLIETTEEIDDKSDSDDEKDQSADVSEDTECNKNKKRADTAKPTIVVKVVSEEEVKSKKFSIYDVVMPLPGCSIEYPPNMKYFYEELLKNDNLTLDLQQKSKSFSVSGAYRYIMSRPKDLTWKCVNYSDPFGDLIISDIKELKGKTEEHDENGKYRALILKFTLPSSTYATMVLRELMKTDTSSIHQALGNNYHKESAEIKEEPSLPQKEGDLNTNVQITSTKSVEESDGEIIEKRKLCNVESNDDHEVSNKKAKVD